MSSYHINLSKKKDNSFDIGSLRMIIFGQMFSGKTTKLITELTTCADIGLRTLYINHSDDCRKTKKFDNFLTSHSSQFDKLSSEISAIKIKSLKNMDVSAYDVIGIDEAQFFEDLIENVRKWVLEDKKHIFIASLDGDCFIKPFGNASELICLCQSNCLIKLSAYCINCFQKKNLLVSAGYTSRLTDSKNQKEIGGSEKYIPLCLKCHREINHTT